MEYLKSTNVTNKFEIDLRKIIYADLNLTKNKEDEFDKLNFIKVLSIHREYMSRLIPKQRYIVKKSNELQQKINLNNFSNLNDINGIRLVINKLQNGQDVTPHLSRTVKSELYNDALFNDWNLYHMHLGINVETDGFVNRTENVLFALRDKNIIYLVDVLPHGNHNIPWTNEELLKIIDNNWPFLLTPYDISDSVIQTSIDFNAQEHYKLRKAQLNVIKKINNRILIPINMGQTLAGTSVHALLMSISLNKHLIFFHNFVIHNYQQISDFIDIKNINLKILKYDNEFNISFGIENSSVKIILLINNSNILTRIIFLREDIQQMLTFAF